MKLLLKVNQWFTQYLWLAVLLAAVSAILVPELFIGLSGYTTYLLQFIMFFMGLTISVDDFTQVLKRPVTIFSVVALQFGIMPVTAFLIAKLMNLPPEMALGLILVGSVPGGTTSNVVTYLSGGDVPLSVTSTTMSTLLAPVMTPLLLDFYGGAYIEIEFFPMFMSMVSVVLLPIVLGLVISYFFSGFTTKVEPVLPSLSATGVLMVLLGTVAVNADNILSSGLVIFAAVTLHHLSGYALGYAGARLTKMNKAETRATSVEVAMQNTGLSASLGMAHFTPMVALAGAVGAVIHTLMGVLYANLMQYLDAREYTSRHVAPEKSPMD